MTDLAPEQQPKGAPTVTEETTLAEKVQRQRNVYPYMRSNHPDVLAAWEELEARWQAFCKASSAWAEKYSGQGSFMVDHGPLRSTACVGVPDSGVDRSALPGRWKKPDRGLVAPYANSEAAREAPEYEPPTIPGRPPLFWGGLRLGNGTLFKHDGYLYSHVNIRDEMGDDTLDAEVMDAYGWEELRGSEYHAAREAREDARNAR